MRAALYHVNRLLPPWRDGVVFLTYHLVAGGTSSPVDVSLDDFTRQLQQLRSHIVSLDTALRRLQQNVAQSGVVLTFDDAFQNFYSTVWPLLLEADAPAVLYVPTGFVERRIPAPLRGAEHLPACSWSQIREMVATGLLTIGSHTCTHPNLTLLDRGRVVRELDDSKTTLEDQIGQPVTSFCYPGGRDSPVVANQVRTRYQNAVVRGGRMATSMSWSPWQLQRVPVKRSWPVNIAPVLQAPVWLEEWLACRASRLRDCAVELSGSYGRHQAGLRA